MDADVYNTYRVSQRNFTISQTGPNWLQNYFAGRDPHPLFEKTNEWKFVLRLAPAAAVARSGTRNTSSDSIETHNYITSYVT